MPCISIIIPCYNAVNYIDRCMDCLRNQTIGFENLQVILVNDGSTDFTLGKMLFYENMFPEQMVVINCEVNCRQGAARNTGLNYAQADFVAFLDVDDVIAESFYEKLYKKIKEGNYDWVSAKYIDLSSKLKPVFKQPLTKQDKEYHCPKEECMIFKDFGSGMCNGKFGKLMSRIFRKSLIIENEIYFPEGLMYEDNFWGAKCDIFSKNVYIIDEVLYCYYNNENSVVSSRNAAYHLDRMKIEEMIVELYKEQGLFDKYHDRIEARFLRLYFCATWFAIFLKMDTIPDVLPVMRKKIYELFPDYKKNPHICRLPLLDQMVLKMLEPEEVYTTEELEFIKEGYIKDFLRNGFV